MRVALTAYCAAVDDEGLQTLVARCQEAAPDVTGEEIAYFVHAKGQVMQRMGNIKNPFGFLLTSVPRCLVGDSFTAYRANQTRLRDEEERRQQHLAEERDAFRREQQAILDDPNACELDKRFARQYLEVES